MTRHLLVGVAQVTTWCLAIPAALTAIAYVI